VIQPPLKRPLTTKLRPDFSIRPAIRFWSAGIAAFVVIGAEVHLRQFAVEQTRQNRADRMAVVDHDMRVPITQTGELIAQRLVIWIEVRGTPRCDLIGMGSWPAL
jgi:hypothetical protein